MPAPLISVVLVCRNPGPRVRDALASVWAQTGVDVETVVIDGASSDGTREWLESQRTRLGALVAEPDTGVYDAMNKGLAAARGEWVLFLGADDRLQDGALRDLAAVLRSTDAGVVVGEAAYEDGRVYRFAGPGAAIRRNFVHHQAACFRRVLFDRHGRFAAGLRVMGDYEFNLRLLKAGVRFQPVPLRVAACAPDGLSDAGGWPGYREEISVRHRYFPAWSCWPWDAGSVMRFIRKQFIRRLS